MRKVDSYSFALVIVLLVVAVLRAVFASVVDLAPDEAYYWAWSNHLAAGYFDHPPAVAWLIGLGTSVFGNTPLGVRMGAILCGAATSYILFILARRLARSSSWAFWITVLASVSPILSTGAVIHTPDAALALAWALSAWFALRAFETNRPRFWIGLGLAVGFAFMAKGSAFLLLAGLGLYSISCKAGKDCLKTSGPVLGFAIAILVASVNMVWNINHQGGSFLFQAEHAAGSMAFDLRGALEFLLGQVGVLSPLLFAALVAFMIVGPSRRVRYAHTEAYLMWCLATPLLLVTFLLSFVHKVEANWPAVAYLSAVAGAAWALSGGWWYLKRRKLWAGFAIAIGLCLTLLIHAQALWALIPLDEHRDPTARLRGWKTMANEAVALADSLNAHLAAEGYGLVSELKFYSGRPVVYERSSSRLSQYDLWPKDAQPERVLFIQPLTSKGKPALCMGASRISDVTPKVEPGTADKTKVYRWWLCEGLKNDSGSKTHPGRDVHDASG